MSFKQLNRSIKISEYQLLETQSKFGIEVDGQFKGIHYRYADSPDFDKVYELVPKAYRQHFCLSVMMINEVIPPHTDSGIKAVINLYLKPDNCSTQFYKFKDCVPSTKQVANQTDGFIFNEDDLVKTRSFIAKPNEVWLLDVTQPHSVTPLGDFTERVVVTMATQKYSYNEVLDIIKGSL
jgi:hypothetical protein